MQRHIGIMELDAGAGATPGYLAGWRYAEWHLRHGGGCVNVDPCDNWADDKANGFCDRLRDERNRARFAPA